MVYVDGVLVFKKGEVEIKECFRPLDRHVVMMANAIIRYDENGIEFLKNRYALSDAFDICGKAIGKAIKLNESLIRIKR